MLCLFLFTLLTLCNKSLNTNSGGADSREAGSEAEVGKPSAGQAAQGHSPGMPGGFCPLHHREEACHVRPLQPGPEGQDAADRLPQTGRQGHHFFKHSVFQSTRLHPPRPLVEQG